MHKALLFIWSTCFLTLAVAPALAADSAAVAATPDAGPDLLEPLKPRVSWMDWGADLRARVESHHNAITLKDKRTASDFTYLRLRSRFWGEFKPVTNLTLFTRLMTEPRYYFQPDALDGWISEEGLIDCLYLQSDILAGGVPVRARIGRQEIAFGDKWLVYDGTPVDGSRSEFFDAARLTLGEGKKLRMDLIGIWIAAEANAHLPVINARNLPLAEQDEQAGIAYLTYESTPMLRLEGYYIFRHLSRQLANGDDGDLHLFGARAAGRISHRWDYAFQAAPQFGRKNGREVRAFGFDGQLNCTLGGTWRQRALVGYEYLSGDDPNTTEDEGWDPVWSRRARWSELLLYTFAAETRGRRGYWTNLQRPYVGWRGHPSERMELQATYMPLLALENPNTGNEMFSEDGVFRGQLIQTVARLKLTSHLSGHLMAELFFPGDYYAPDHRDTAAFFRAELMLAL